MAVNGALAPEDVVLYFRRVRRYSHIREKSLNYMLGIVTWHCYMSKSKELTDKRRWLPKKR